MAGPFVPGPAPLWIAYGQQPYFLGWSERGVSIDLGASYVPYHNDLGGQEMLDLSYQGQNATINFVLTRWNAIALASIEDYAGILPGSTPGGDVAGEIGTLMAYEGAAFSLWIGFPYAAKAAYSTHMLGYHFPATVLERDSLPERGSKPARVACNVRAIRQLIMTPATQNGLVAGALKLYDYDMTAILGKFPD